MCHAPVDASVGARDALDGVDRAIRIVRLIERRLALLVHVLRGDLSAYAQCRHRAPIRIEPPLAVRYCQRMRIADIHAREPRREIRCNAHAHGLRDMPPDVVVRQGRRILIEIRDLAVGQKAELQECLETVAYPEDQTVVIVQEAMHCLGNLRCTEHRRDELARPIRLVTAAEPARQHEDLRALDRLRHRRHRLLDRLRREVAHDHDLRLRADALPRTCRVVLAVRPREHGDADARFCNLEPAALMLPLRIGCKGRAIDLTMRMRHRRREDLFQRLGVRRLDIGKHNGVEIRDDARHVARNADLDRAHAREVRIEVERGRHLEQDRAIERLKEIVLRNIGRKLKAEVVAEAHLRECRRNAAAADALRGEHLLSVDQLMHLCKVLAQTLKDGQILHITRNGNHNDTVAGVFELR